MINGLSLHALRSVHQKYADLKPADRIHVRMALREALQNPLKTDNYYSRKIKLRSISLIIYYFSMFSVHFVTALLPAKLSEKYVIINFWIDEGDLPPAI